MSYRKNTKKKIIAAVLAIIMLVQVAVSTFASEQLDGSDYEALGSSATLGASATTLGMSLRGPYAAGDITVALSNNAPTAGFQTYTTGFGAEPPELVTSLTVAVKKADVVNGKIVLNFASKKGYLGTDFFVYDRIQALPADTIFAGAPTVDPIFGTVTLTLKPNVALNSTEGVTIFHKYNKAQYDGAAAPASVLAELSAKAFVGSTEVNATAVQQVKAVDIGGMPHGSIQPFFPTSNGTEAAPAIVMETDTLSARQTVQNNAGLFSNKFDTSEKIRYRTFFPNGTTAVSGHIITQNYVVDQAESTLTGIPKGTYAVHSQEPNVDGRTGWNINYNNNINSNYIATDISYKLPPGSDGKTYTIYRQLSFKHLGADKVTYRPISRQYFKVDNSRGWKLNFSAGHNTGDSRTGSSGIENGNIGDANIATGWGYTHMWSQRNEGSVPTLGTEKVLYQTGAGPARANFDFIGFYFDRPDASIVFPSIEYYFVIGSDKGHADRTTTPATAATASTVLTLPTLDSAKGEYIKEVHTVPVVGGVKGVWPSGVSIRYIYKIKAWPDKKWPDGSTITNGRHPVDVYWKINYTNPETSTPATYTGEKNSAGYITGASTPWAKGAAVPGTTPGSVSPGEEILYRINGYNYNQTAKSTWDDPTIIMSLPAGITLAETTGIELKNAAGVSQGAVTVTAQGTDGTANYYRLQAPAGYKAPIVGGVSFYMDVKLKLPSGIAQANYQPYFALTNLDSENFFATNLTALTAVHRTAYGLGPNEKAVIYRDGAQTSLGVIGSTKTSSNSKIKSDATGGVWSSDNTVAATFGETVGVQLNVVNEGNRALGGFRLYDIVPYGDYLNSSNNCSISLDSVSSSFGAPDYWFYTAAGPPPLSDIQSITLPSAGWVKGMPADKSTIKAFLVDFKTTQLPGGNTLTVDIGFKIPAAAAGEQLANNKFSYAYGEVNASNAIVNVQTFTSPQQGFTTASYYIDYVDDFGTETANWPNNDSGILMGNATDFLKVTASTPTRPGYFFKEWNTKANGSGTKWLPNATKMFSPNDKSLELHAIWTVDSTKTITATYKLVGGNVAGATADILQAGKKVEDTLTLPVPVRVGYTFDAWYEGAVKWEPTAKIQSKHIAANGLTLTAKWNVDNTKKVTVKFTTADAANVTGMPATQALSAGGTVVQPTAPVRAGYTLTGWKYKAAPWVFTTPIDTEHFGGAAPNYEMTLDAIWAISDGTGGKPDVKINVTFDLAGGKISGSEANVVRIGQHVESKPAIPTGISKDGYTFSGWYEKIGTAGEKVWDGTRQLDSGHISAGSLTLTAKWAIDPSKTITATYKLTGGNVGGATTDILQAGKKVEDTLSLPTPVRVGYTFDAWYEGAVKWESTTKIQSKHITANGVTLTAKWNVDNTQKVTVKFTTADTAHVTGMPATQALSAGSTIVQPTAPVRAGYTLTGWKYKAASWVFTTPVDTQHFSGAAPNYEMTLEAIWAISDGTGGKPDVKIDVTFDLGGGKIGGSAANVVRAGQHVEAKPSIPTGISKDGFTFLSWREKIGTAGEKIWDGTRQLDSGHMADGGLTLTAKWSINPYTVTFNSDSGNTTPAPVMDDYDTVIQLPDVAKTGYTFKGWMNPAGIVIGQVGDNYTIKADIILKAKWEINPYTLTFVTEAGVTAPATMTRDYNTTIALPNAPKTGYSLEGWYNGSNVRVGGIGDSFTITEDSSLSAKWTINPYTVTFVPMGGTPAPGAVTQNYNTTTILPNVNRYGYTFKGWMNPATAVVGLAGENYTIEADIILTAKWEIVGYTLTFDSKGGTAPVPATITKDYQQQAGTLPVVSRAGYTFDGWFNEANQLINNTYSIEKSELIIAKWSPKTYIVTFDNNGGTTGTTPASVNIVFDTNIPVLPTTGSGAPTKLGHTFVGWSTASGASNANNFISGTNYAIDAAVGNLTVYAIWTQDEYSLKLNCNTPANTNMIIPVNYDSVVTLPYEGHANAPKKTGYELGGWANLKTGPCDYVFGDDYTHVLEGDKTLFADWSAKSYSVVFNNNGGDTATSPAQKTVVFDQSVGILPNVADGTAPTKVGHTFKGWSTDSGSTNVVNFKDNSIYKNDSPSGTLTVYAVWEIITYKISVETYTYNYDAGEATAVKADTKVNNITYGETFVAPTPVIPEYSFIKAEPNVAISLVNSDATIKLYYQQVTYELAYDKDVVVDVNDRYPEKNNVLALEDFFVAANVSVTSSAADARSLRSAGLAGNPKITTVGFDGIDYAKVSTNSQKVTVTFTWKNGQTKTAEFDVKVSDRTVPVINMPPEQRFRFIHGREEVPTSEAELLSLLYAKGLSVMDNYDGQIDPTVTYIDGSFDKIKWDQAGEHGLLIGAVDSSGNLADKQKAIAVVWVAGVGDNGDSGDDDGKGPGKGGDGDSPLKGDGGNNNFVNNNNSANKNPEGNHFDDKGNLIDAKGNKLVDASKLPEGSSLNAKGQLIDSKGNLINLNGSAGGNLPRTGAIVGSSLLVIALVALLLLLLLKKKKDDTKDKNQI